MSAATSFPREELGLLKWQIALLCISILIALGVYFGVDYLDTQSLGDLRSAQAGYENAVLSVDLIEQEEATIIEYIDRYKELSNDGIVGEEDRLQFLEKISQIRSANNLFPISLNINEQTGVRLLYSPDESEPGGPIELHASSIDISLPLLHEGDLIRLLNAILTSPGLYQTRECNMVLKNASNRNFYVLSQHLAADCHILWYTFDVNPPNNPVF